MTREQVERLVVDVILGPELELNLTTLLVATFLGLCLGTVLIVVTS